jgi:moderate conductance mechanosensitive channel
MDNFSWWMTNVITPAIYVGIGFLVYNILESINNKGYIKAEDRKRKTVIVLLNNIVKYVIALFVIAAILNNYGVNTSSILASLGIAGLVVGLALQDLIKDFVAGTFIIFDNLYAVGDTVTINSFRGEVISLGLKTTKIKDCNGNILSISNGSITQVINHSLADQLATVSIDVAYEEDLDKVLKVMNDFAEKEKIKDTKGPINVLGVTALGASGVTITLNVPTKAGSQFAVERELRKDIKMELDRKKIVIPYNQMVVHNVK